MAQDSNQAPNRLQELRLRSRLTQAELAKLLDLSISTVAKHERGTRRPDREDIVRYAAVFKVETYELFLPWTDPTLPSPEGYDGVEQAVIDHIVALDRLAADTEAAALPV